MQFYSIEEVMKMLSISRALVYKWERNGKLKITRINGVPRISEEEIKRIVEGE